MSETPQITVAKALSHAKTLLDGAGVPNAARDAQRLMQHVCGPLLPSELVPDPRGFFAAIAARVRRQPVSQITGRRAFWTAEFEVTRDTLDPRPETEALVGAVLDGPVTRLLDLGTGTGCILLSILAERPDATGLGTDISEAALVIARRNAARLDLADRAAFARADWLDGIDGSFDLIVSNPPYIAEAELPNLAPEVRDWEPRMALTPGGDGLDAYRAIAREAPARLAPSGRLMVEIGAGQAEAVTALWQAAGLAEIRCHSDLDGRDRVVSGRGSVI